MGQPAIAWQQQCPPHSCFNHDSMAPLPGNQARQPRRVPPAAPALPAAYSPPSCIVMPPPRSGGTHMRNRKACSFGRSITAGAGGADQCGPVSLEAHGEGA